MAGTDSLVNPEITNDDLREGWVIEANNQNHDGSDNWCVAWESWFVEDSAEAARIEKQYAKRGEAWAMTPRPFEVLLALFKVLRPADGAHDWRDYRFKNVNTGMIIHAWLLK